MWLNTRSLIILCVVLALASITTAECNIDSFLEHLVVNPTVVSCFGGSDASLTLEYSEESGCKPSLFTLKKGGFSKSSTKGEFKELSAGEYELVIKFEEVKEIARQSIQVDSASAMNYTSTVEDLNGLVCNSCLSTAHIVMKGGVGPYFFNDVECEENAFELKGICYGTKSFSVTDSKGCVASFDLELPPPFWCTMDNESSSSLARDYWTIPSDMLPWLIVVCAVVAVFIVAIAITCIAWSRVSEHTRTEPKQRLLEQGAKSPSPDVANARVHDYEPEAEPQKTNDQALVHEESAVPMLAPAPVTTEKKKKKKKKKQAEETTKNGGEVELEILDNKTEQTNEGEQAHKKKKKKTKKQHKAEEEAKPNTTGAEDNNIPEKVVVEDAVE